MIFPVWKSTPKLFMFYSDFCFPQPRTRLWSLQSVKQRRGDRVFGSRVPDNVRDVCVLDCRNWIWRPRVKIHLSYGAARDRSSLFDGTCLFAHGARSKCARGVRTQPFFCGNMPLCARSEIQVCSQRANAAVLSHEQVFLRTREIQLC